MHNVQRQVAGIYLIGQVITDGDIIKTYTAYNRNTNDVVGLSVLELPANLPPATALPLLQPLEQRKTIQSPHILRIHDWGIDGTRVYIATDPPRGITLQQVMDNENIDLKRALDISKQLAQGLKVFHEKGIAGLDLRPQFITVDTVGIMDRVQIDDIGLRTLLATLGYHYVGNQHSNDIGILDPRYSAPEYIQGGAIGSESDVYQLGLLLFTLITGRLPFVGRTIAETGVMQTNNPVPPMHKFNHQVPVQLQQIVERAMAKERHQRYPNADILLTVLENVELPLSAAERMAQSGKQATIAFTREMQKIDEDILASVPLDEPLEVHTVQTAAHGDATTVYAYLSFERDGREVQRLDIIQKHVIVGRSDPKRGYSPDIDLSSVDAHRTVSRQHARIRFEETFFSIEDLKSHNKTRVSELPLEPLKPEVIKDGDVVHFGRVRMRFRVPHV